MSFVRALLDVSLLLCVCASTCLAGWHADAPCLKPQGGGNWDSVSVKDPSIVYYGGAWHVFFTMMDGNNWRMGYATASTIAGLRAAPHIKLTSVQGGNYFCAPQVFYFTPHAKWYLFYQSAGSTYSTNTDITNPNGWTAGKSMGWSESGSLDYFYIAEGSKPTDRVYAFYSIDQQNTGCRTRWTTVANFPSKGWSSGSVAAGPVFEGFAAYKNKADGKFYLLGEDLSRYYRLWSANSLAGPWTSVAQQWAAKSNLQDNAGVAHWTDQVSHGELVRSGYNELVEVDDLLNHCDFLIQGVTSGKANVDYGHIPYQLGIIRNYVCPNGGTDCTPIPSTVKCATAPPNPPNGAFATCSNVAVGGTCALTCNAGYTASGAAATCASSGEWTSVPTCSPAANLCATNNGGCGDAASTTCAVSGNAVKCACKSGYSGNPPTTACTVVPTNLCATNNGGCGDAASTTCAADGSSVKCACKSGYSGNPPTTACTLVTTNLCATNNGGCGDAASTTCATDGSAVKCACKSGYEGNPPTTTCTVVTTNLCATNNGGCGDAATTTCVTDGSAVTCACKSGYSGNPPTTACSGGSTTCWASAVDVGSNSYWVAFNVQTQADHAIKTVAVVNAGTSTALGGPFNWGSDHSSVFAVSMKEALQFPFTLVVTDSAGGVNTLKVNALAAASYTCA